MASSTLVDLVKIYAASTGTGAITLGGAVPGYRGREAFVNGNVYSYSIQQEAEWEFGRGTYLLAQNVLVRSPLGTSNGGQPLNLQPNASISVVALAEDLYDLAGVGTVDTQALAAEVARATAVEGFLSNRIVASALGIVTYADTTAMNADTSRPIGTFGLVTSTNTFYRYTSGGWVLDPSFSTALASFIQPLVDQAVAAASDAQDAAELADLSADRAEAAAGRVEGFDAFVGPLLDRMATLAEIRDTNGRLIEATLPNGDIVSFGQRAGQMFVSDAFIGPLLGGQAPVISSFDRYGRLMGATLRNGVEWVALDGVFAPTTPAGGSTTAEALPQTFVRGSNSAQQPVNYYANGPTWIIFAHLGQSNAQGEGLSSDPLVATTPIYPDSSFMFANGPRRENAAPNRTLTPLIETISSSGGQRETMASGLASHFIRDIEAATGIRPKCLSFVTALGGQPYYNLGQGSPTYENFLQAMRDSAAVIRALAGDNVRIVTVPIWTQGPSDTTAAYMTTSRYVAQMKQFSRQLNGAIKEITGEKTDPVLFLVQESTQLFANSWFNPAEFGDFAVTGMDNIRLVGPTYPYPYIDQFHMSCIGRNLCGQAVSKAVVNELFKQSHRGVVPSSYRWTSATRLLVEFDRQGANIVLDRSGGMISTSGLVADGFRFKDGTNLPPTITSVSVVDGENWPQSNIQIDLSAAPANLDRWLGYAIERDASQTGGYPGQNGPVIGPRGTLRDDAGSASLYFTSGPYATQYDWASSFKMRV